MWINVFLKYTDVLCFCVLVLGGSGGEGQAELVNVK